MQASEMRKEDIPQRRCLTARRVRTSCSQPQGLSMIFEVLGRMDCLSVGDVFSVLICCAPMWCLDSLTVIRGVGEHW